VPEGPESEHFLINILMITEHIITESAAGELAKKLPSLQKHDYDTIDRLMKQIATKHSISGKALHDLFVKKYKRTPDIWVKGKLDETAEGEDLNDNPVMKKFIQWTAQKLHLKKCQKLQMQLILCL
jgi:hypothetical protein